MAGSIASKNLVYLLNALVDEDWSALKVAVKASAAVTGTFWQAIQPVSGTFWQAIQPVSGTFWQAIQPVSGAFWQAVQPVSGTFWQAIQPVSQVLNGAAVQGDLTVTVTPVPLRVGSSNQAGRKLLFIMANSAGYTFGFSATSQPFSLQSATPLTLNVGENVTVWAKKSSGTNTITVAELS